LKIDTSKNRIYTPTRGIIHTDHNRFRNLAKYQPTGQWNSSASVPHSIHEIVLDYNPEALSRLLNENKYFNSQLANLRKLAKRSNGRHCHAFLQIRNQTNPIDDNGIIALTELQLKSNQLDMITIPDPSPNSSDVIALENAIKIAQKRMILHGFDEGLLMPYLDLSTDREEMNLKIRYLIEEGFSAIGIRHRENKVGSSLVIEGIAEEAAVWFHVSGVKKHHRINRVVPSIHIMPVHSFDSMTRYKGLGYVPKPQSDVFPEPKPRKIDHDEMLLRAAVQAVSDKMEYFEPECLGYLSSTQHESMFEDGLNCTCPLCNGKNLNEFKEYAFDNDGYDSNKFTSYCIVHESISSHNELNNAHNFIKNSSYLEYLKSKSIIGQYFNRLNELTVGSLRRSPIHTI